MDELSMMRVGVENAHTHTHIHVINMKYSLDYVLYYQKYKNTRDGYEMMS